MVLFKCPRKIKVKLIAMPMKCHCQGEQGVFYSTHISNNTSPPQDIPSSFLDGSKSQLAIDTTHVILL